MSNSEMQQIALEWNKGDAGYTRSGCAHEVIEKQAEARAEAVAVVFESEQITYGELNARANKLAHYLRRMGVEPEERVFICMERSIEMIIAMLGVLKAGGGYVPVAPNCLPERYKRMVEDAQARIVVAHEETADRVGKCGEKVVVIDRQWQDIATEVEENPVSGADGKNLAYVIYAPGPTGLLIGTCVSHNSIVRMVENSNFIKVEAYDRIAQTTGISSGLAAIEIFNALLCGASLAIITKHPSLSPNEFAAQIREQTISVLFIASDAFNYLAGEVPRAYESLRHLISVGEGLDIKCVKEIQSKNPPGQLINIYGPVECAVVSTWHEIKELSEEEKIIPIGRPVSNTRIYILDGDMTPVPAGVTGQLYIGDDGLSRGYLNSPGMTSDKFVPDPFNSAEGARLYKTGDTGCYLQDANICHSGRIDHRITINGFIVEPAEVEMLLCQHPLVRQAVIASHVGASYDKRLIAYLVASDEAILTPSELRTYLKQRVPDYMIPTSFIFMEEMPLMRGGKIDRKSLPLPDRSRPELMQEYVAPRNAVEEVLAKIWSELFGIEKIGVNDNFFQLGGHSLLATQANFRTSDALMVDMYLCDIFEAPTVAKLTKRLLNNTEQSQKIEKIAAILISLDQYSDEEVEKMLSAKKSSEEDTLE